MRLGSLKGLATTDLRDQFIRLSVALSCLVFCFAQTATANTILNILTQPRRLDANLVEEFELSRKVSVRVEFVSSPLDYESRIKSLPHSWDLVLADEQRLVTLSLAKILKTLPDSVMIPPNLSGLDRRARANEDGRAYINLMADPMGLIYLNRTKTGLGPVGWTWIINPSLNPLWRSRVALFADDRLNLMTAAVATGVTFPVEKESDNRKVFDWLTRAQLQGRNTPLNTTVTSFLAEKYAVGLAWQSDYLHALRYVKGLAFTVPVEGTYVERVGVGLVADCRNEALALDFIKFIHERRDQLAQRRGMLPLHVQDFQGSQVRDWRIFSDDVPRLKELANSVAKMKRDRDLRAEKAR
jgi:spermidine/putrescine-binding protein